MTTRTTAAARLTGMTARLLVVFALTGCATARPMLTGGPEWVRAEQPMPDLHQHQVLFVSGFMNELIGGYFVDNAAVARELGAETAVVQPRSSDAVTTDVQRIEQEVTLRQGKALVLVGHSKGGAAVLLAALRHPEWFERGLVDSVIVIQGAVGGSPLADVAMRVPIVRNMKGLRSLSTTESRSVFTEALTALEANTSPEQRMQLFSRVFYVRSAHEQSLLPAELALTELLLRGAGPNDGLVTQNDMKLGRGVDLGVLDADHASLTVSSFLATSSVEERRAFTRALLSEVGARRQWPTLK